MSFVRPLRESNREQRAHGRSFNLSLPKYQPHRKLWTVLEPQWQPYHQRVSFSLIVNFTIIQPKRWSVFGRKHPTQYVFDAIRPAKCDAHN